eukprot:11988008-Alexandrium_andersonii.AAC.1
MSASRGEQWVIEELKARAARCEGFDTRLARQGAARGQQSRGPKGSASEGRAVGAKRAKGTERSKRKKRAATSAAAASSAGPVETTGPSSSSSSSSSEREGPPSAPLANVPDDAH